MVLKKNREIFLKEINEKEIKYIKVYDAYRRNYNKTTQTPKFYSKYEGEEADIVDPEILKNIMFIKDSGPKDKLEWPETENQKYGWFITPLVEVVKSDPRFYFPRVVNEITKHGLKMLQCKAANIR
ncbi:protein FAM183A-like [Sitophilus oryzae]|uniref:Protein FAM183A-like n=1 Tax=Sitophilus oryzae TaxID=7048 RepID=A0A6J2XGV7_SITOR|nr:protein FAM183A-like [Sitophilus oryzae]